MAREGGDLWVGARNDDGNRSDADIIRSGSAYAFKMTIDSTPPSITPIITGTLGNNDWYTSDVALSWSVQDIESDWVVDEGCDSVSLTTDTDPAVHPAGESFACEVTSVGGSATNSIALKRDATAPVVTISGVNDGDSFELGNEPAPECLTSDATSGVATAALLDIVADPGNPGDGTGQFTVECVGAEDNAGNGAFASLVYSVSAPADTTPPVITYALTGTLGANGWYTSDVSLVWSVTDDESAVVSSGCDMLTLDSDTASQSFSCEAISEGGTSTETVTLKRDTTSPNLTFAPEPLATTNGWHNTDVTVTYTCTDETSGVDPVASDLATDVLTATGSALATCVDFAGNNATASYSAQIDKDKPVISSSLSPTANGAGWHNTVVTVSFSCTDSASGIDQDTVSGTSVTLSEGANQSASSSGMCTDLAGNSADAVTQTGINIDVTAPNVTITGVSEGASYPQGSEPSPSCDTQDALSGTNTAASLAIVGGPTGLVTASCRGATDLAGNISQDVSVSYTIEASSSYDFSGFLSPVDHSPVLNIVKAGRTIPIKFSLGGDFGLGIFENNYPRSRPINCTSKIPLAAEEATNSNSGLSYSESSNTYTYGWKTEKIWKDTCREFILRLDDGTEASAYFSFH